MIKVKSIAASLFIVMFMSFNLEAQCDAGDNTLVDICANADAIDLFAEIDGTPITGGFWLDPSDNGFTNPFDPAADVAGVYQYIVDTDLNGNPCPVNDTAFVSVAISSIPSVTFNMSNNQGCGSFDSQFTNTSVAPGFTSCTWDFGDGSLSTACNPVHTFSEPGCYDISLTLRNGIGCQATDTIVDAACVKEEPVASFDLETNPISTSLPIGNFINNSENGVTYEWIIPEVGNYNSFEPVVDFPSQEKIYFVCLEVMAANGCEDTYCSNVIVRDDALMYVPTAFTPNLDRVNEIFKPTLTFEPQIYEMTIYDRWGGIVFQSFSPNEGWNGSTEDSFFAADGYYSYRIKAVKDAEVIERIGQVMIIR